MLVSLVIGGLIPVSLFGVLIAYVDGFRAHNHEILIASVVTLPVVVIAAAVIIWRDFRKRRVS